MGYVYHNVVVEGVTDGDTVKLLIDMGNSIHWRGNFRLFGIDTPERGKPLNTEATARLTALLQGGISRIETHKPDKYGRWLVDIYIPTEQGGTLHVNTLMVVEGLAKPYFGGKKT